MGSKKTSEGDSTVTGKEREEQKQTNKQTNKSGHLIYYSFTSTFFFSFSLRSNRLDGDDDAVVPSRSAVVNRIRADLALDPCSRSPARQMKPYCSLCGPAGGPVRSSGSVLP